MAHDTREAQETLWGGLAIRPLRGLPTRATSRFEIASRRLGLVLVAVALSFGGCQRFPKGDWHIESGRAYVVDDRGVARTRVEAAEDARRSAQLRILKHVKAMPAGDNLVADYMQQNAVLGVRIRSLILSAREFERRYTEDGAVEVTMGVNLEEVRRIVRETGP